MNKGREGGAASQGFKGVAGGSVARDACGRMREHNSEAPRAVPPPRTYLAVWQTGVPRRIAAVGWLRSGRSRSPIEDTVVLQVLNQLPRVLRQLVELP
jgi:hypothetical protein